MQMFQALFFSLVSKILLLDTFFKTTNTSNPFCATCVLAVSPCTEGLQNEEIPLSIDHLYAEKTKRKGDHIHPHLKSSFLRHGHPFRY